MQRAMKRMLAEERLRRLAHSAALAAERAPLLQLLSPQMLRDDGTNMERTFQVRSSHRQVDAAGARHMGVLAQMLSVGVISPSAYAAVNLVHRSALHGIGEKEPIRVRCGGSIVVPSEAAHHRILSPHP